MTEETLTDVTRFKPKQRVWYVPFQGCDPSDIEPGLVSSARLIRATNGVRVIVFVKFEKQLAKFGWDGTTSQGCDSRDLLTDEPL